MHKSDKWTSLVLLFLGTVTCKGSLNLGVGTWTVPGPGFMPFGAGLVLIFFSLCIFILAVLKREQAAQSSEKFFLRPESWKPVVLVFLALFGFYFVWTKLGFFLTALITMGFLFFIVGKRRWWIALMATLLTTFITYILFVSFLKVQFPPGILGH